MENLTCVIGGFGKGKSLHLLELGLEISNFTRKVLVTNFPLNRSVIRQYCKLKKLYWFYRFGLIISYNLDDADKTPLSLLRPNSVVLFDEAGRYLNSRKWQDNSQFGSRLATIRHDNIHLICAFQFYEQVDKNIRESAQTWVVCTATTVYLRSIQRPYLISRYCKYYSREKFQKLLFDSKLATSSVLSWKFADKVVWRISALYHFIAEFKTFVSIFISAFRSFRGFCHFLSFEQLLFKCYNSLGFSRSFNVPCGSSRVVYVDFESLKQLKSSNVSVFKRL